MTTNFIYSLTCSVVIGIFAMNSLHSSSSTDYDNSTFIFLENTKEIEQDTTPHHSNSRETYRTNDGNQKIYLSIKDGEIKKLKINGKKIPKSKYEDYNDLIAELRSSNNTPTPPTPPSMDEIEKTHESIAEAHAQIEEAHQEIELAHQEIEKKHGSTSEAIAEALMADGLISNDQNYKFRLTRKKFKVDGKVQDKTTHQKYLKLYERLTGGKMNNNSTYQVSHNAS